MRTKNDINAQKGMTLIEAAIAVVIIGLLLAGITAFYDRSQEQAVLHKTNSRMQTVISALSTYVETYGRLPCPADPARNDAAFGWEWGVTPADTTTANTAAPIGVCSVAANTVAGIVPFQTLNLPPEIAQDGWGRYLTYAVSPVFTLDNDANAPDPAGQTPNDDTDRVHERCRNHAWVDIVDNINSVKARFCCAVRPAVGPYHAPATDLVIQDLTGANIGPALRYDAPPPPPPIVAGDLYNVLTQENDDAFQRPIVSTNTITAPALVLISHGADGRGAFLANNTANQFEVNNAFTLELQNWDHNANRIYNLGPVNQGNAPATYYDDIVLWMTQDGIMAANGTSSCQYP